LVNKATAFNTLIDANQNKATGLMSVLALFKAHMEAGLATMPDDWINSIETVNLAIPQARLWRDEVLNEYCRIKFEPTENQ
jgi:hypothetical protein